MKTPTNIDWTPLAGITRHPKTQPGFAAFTPEEAARIRAFYRQSGLPLRLIAERLGVSINTVHRCVMDDTKYVRRNMHGKTKARYWKRKAQRQAAHGAWQKEVEV